MALVRRAFTHSSPLHLCAVLLGWVRKPGLREASSRHSHNLLDAALRQRPASGIHAGLCSPLLWICPWLAGCLITLSPPVRWCLAPVLGVSVFDQGSVADWLSHGAIQGLTWPSSPHPDTHLTHTSASLRTAPTVPFRVTGHSVARLLNSSGGKELFFFFKAYKIIFAEKPLRLSSASEECGRPPRDMSLLDPRTRSSGLTHDCPCCWFWSMYLGFPTEANYICIYMYILCIYI